MLRLTAILLMTCALVSVYGRDKTAIDHAREDVEAAKKSLSVPAPPAPAKRSDSTTVTIIRKMKRKEYSVPRSNQE